MGKNTWEEYLAIADYVWQHGYNVDAIAEEFELYIEKGKYKGRPNRTYIFARLHLMQLPLFVRIEIRKYCADISSSNIRWSHIASLYSAYRADGEEFRPIHSRFDYLFSQILAGSA